MKNSAKVLTVLAVALITLGAIVLSLGSFGYQASLEQSGANIGAGIALLIGPYIVGAGLLLGICAGGMRLLAARGE